MSGESKPGDTDIAQAATAAGSSNPPPSEGAPIGAELGRYKIQRELGRGGMGVVHAAFDPDLERKVALKVLRGAGENVEARERLLREARAMARLAHPNVLTVHEVGAASGQDFIAMELVDGGTLDDWLAAAERSERDIVAAFLAAGRGLAAAHAAGLVHRDFKPHNVLRHKDGRIAVTDFGLVTSDAQPIDTLTLPAGASTDSSTTPSWRKGLTQTGALLGTPAYMAPEQWTGGAVGPAADQFAFCVALWEALAKERPYRGKTLAELQDQVTHGERGDDVKLPRRLRPILKRGLDPDPAKRFPSTEALLAAITRAERPRFLVSVVVGGVALAAAVATVYLALGRAPATAVMEAPCAAPVLPVESVWSAKDRESMRAAKQPLAADAIERDFKTWGEVRARACKAAPQLRALQLSCLDGVLATMADQKTAIFEAAPKRLLDITSALIDPTVCDSAKPPRFVSPISHELHALSVSVFKESATTDEFAKKLVEDSKLEPCASAQALMLSALRSSRSDAEQLLASAESDAERCGDDRVQANAALAVLRKAFVADEPQLTAKIERAEALVDRVKQPELEATLEELRAQFEMQADHKDEAITRLEHAVQLYEQRHAIQLATNTRIDLIDDRWDRASPADMRAIPDLIAEARAKIVAAVGVDDPFVDMVDDLESRWLWSGGEIVAADKLRGARIRRDPLDEPRPARGIVVDETGAPVAGATVTTGQVLNGDPLYAAQPAFDQLTATTDAKGRFEIANAEIDSIAIAQAGTRRSEPVRVTAADLTLTVRPTSRVSGKVLLHDHAPSLVRIGVEKSPKPADLSYSLDAPVLPDGTFVIDGVPRGAVTFTTLVDSLAVGAQSRTVKRVIISQPVIQDVQLEVPVSTGTLHVLVRTIYGEEILHANVFVLSGTYPAETTVAKMLSAFETADTKMASLLTPEQDTGVVHAKAKKGDLYVLANRPAGTASACAMPLPKNLDDPHVQEALQKRSNDDKIGVRCVRIDPKDEVIVLSLPPWPRFD